MRIKFPPVDNQLFREYVENNQGELRRVCFKNFQAEGAKKSAQQSRYKAAIIRGVKAGWLFVQRDGGSDRFFTTTYAMANNIQGKVEAPFRAHKPSNKHDPEIVELLARVNWIDSLMPASSRAFINNCTF